MPKPAAIAHTASNCLRRCIVAPFVTSDLRCGAAAWSRRARRRAATDCYSERIQSTRFLIWSWSFVLMIGCSSSWPSRNLTFGPVVRCLMSLACASLSLLSLAASSFQDVASLFLSIGVALEAVVLARERLRGGGVGRQGVGGGRSAKLPRPRGRIPACNVDCRSWILQSEGASRSRTRCESREAGVGWGSIAGGCWWCMGQTFAPTVLRHLDAGQERTENPQKSPCACAHCNSHPGDVISELAPVAVTNRMGHKGRRPPHEGRPRRRPAAGVPATLGSQPGFRATLFQRQNPVDEIVDPVGIAGLDDRVAFFMAVVEFRLAPRGDVLVELVLGAGDCPDTGWRHPSRPGLPS